MEKQSREETSPTAKLKFLSLYVISLIFGITMYALNIAWNKDYRGGFAWSSNVILQMNWHPILLILGLICFYSQSILVFRLGRNLSKKMLKMVHVSLNLVAFILSVVGVQAAFDMRNFFNGIHLYSLHSWIGILTITLFATQFFCGFVIYGFPSIPLKLRAAFMPAHRASGIGIFFLAVISVATGLMTKTSSVSDYSSLSAETYVINFLTLFLVVFAALVLYLVNAAEYRRIPLPSD